MSCAECLKPKIGKAHPYFPEEYIYAVGYCLIKYDIMNLIYIKDDYICHCIKSKVLITITIFVNVDKILSLECVVFKYFSNLFLYKFLYNIFCN